jgi:formyl-CoA transferase
VVVAGNSDAIFERFMRTIGRDDLADDADLADNMGRWARRDELDLAISQWTDRHSRDFVLKTLDGVGVPAGPIQTAADIVGDRQFLARDMLQEFPVETGDGLRPVLFPGVVPLLGERSVRVRSVGPDLGEHTLEILS